MLRFCYSKLCLFLTLLYYNKLLPFRTKYSNSSWTCSAGPTNQSHFDSGSLCGIQSNASGLIPERLICHACWMLPPNLLDHYIVRATMQWSCKFFSVLKMGRAALYTIKTSCKIISGLTRVAVKMLKPHHNGSEHAEADLLSEYNLLKEVRQFLSHLDVWNFFIFVFFRVFIKQTPLLVSASLTGNESFFLQLRLYNMFWWVNVVRHVFEVFKVLCWWSNIFIIFSALSNGNLRIHISESMECSSSKVCHCGLVGSL